MKYIFLITVVLVLYYFSGSEGHLALPTYITACSRTDPKIDECAKKHAQAAIPTILKGDKKYAVPNFTPLVLPEVDLQAGKNFNLKFKNLRVDGLEDCIIEKIHIDPSKHTSDIVVRTPKLVLSGPYSIEGKILVLPIEGKGDAKIVFTDDRLSCNVEWDLIKGKDGVELAKVKNPVGGYDTKNVKYEFENLFNGDKKLGAEMLNVMNDNWNVVNEDLRGPLTEVIKQVCFTIVDGYFGKVPYNQIFV